MVKSISNNSTTPISASSSFYGTPERTNSNVEISVVLKADQPCTLFIDQSPDQVNWDARAVYAYTPSDSKSFQVGTLHQYFRVIVANTGGIAMNLFRLTSYLNEEYSALKITGSDGSGVTRHILTDEQGKLQVSLTGTAGPPGPSAYEIAVDAGFVGTEQQWVVSLAGVDGVNGSNGSNGTDGNDGLSAYQLAVIAGFVGTEQQWLASLDGQDGTNGSDGLSAYQVWLLTNPGGSMEQYLSAIRGPGLSVKGTMANETMIFALNPATLSINDAWFADDTFKLYVWDGQTWVESGELRGAQGVKGDKGDDGPALNVLGTVSLTNDLPAGAVARLTAYFVEETNSLEVATGAGTWISSGSLKGDTGDQGVSFQFLGSLTAAEIIALPLTVADSGSVYLSSDTYVLYAWSGAAFTVSASIRGPKGDKGDPGNAILAKGQVALIADLTPLTATAVQGDMWVVLEDKRMYVYNGTGFIASGNSIEGPQGPVGSQGSVGSVGLTGASIQLISTVNAAVDLPTGYNGNDIGKAHFIETLFSLVVWDGQAFVSSGSLRGPLGLTGNSFLLQGQKATTGDLPAGYGTTEIGFSWYVVDQFAYYTWDGASFVSSGNLRGVQGDAGADLTVKGTLALIADLAGVSPAPVKGDAWFVTEDKSLYIYDGAAFISSGSLQGVQGEEGYSFIFMGSFSTALIQAFILSASDQGRVYLSSDDYKLYYWTGSAFTISGSIRGAVGPTGENVTVKGNVSDLVALAGKVATAVVGDGWFVLSDDTLNIFDGVAFQSSGSLTGPQGPAGTLPAPTIVSYQVASGTGGGTMTASAWTIRPLNSVSNPGGNGGISLNANVITLATTGTYKLDFNGVVFDAGRHMSRIYNLSTGSTIGTGQSDTCSNNNGGHSHGVSVVTVAAGTQLELQHFVSTSTTNNLGDPVSSGENELFASIIIEKLA